jgi:hypothetical protein
MQKSFHWGHGVTLFFISFACMMGYLVYRCTQVPVNLVEADYYHDELRYQEVIDGTKRANELSGTLSLETLPQGLQIHWPAEMQGKNLEGEIWFYCPSNASQDRHITLKDQHPEHMVLPNSLLAPGSYVVKFRWMADGIEYYTEKSLEIS